MGGSSKKSDAFREAMSFIVGWGASRVKNSVPVMVIDFPLFGARYTRATNHMVVPCSHEVVLVVVEAKKRTSSKKLKVLAHPFSFDKDPSVRFASLHTPCRSRTHN